MRSAELKPGLSASLFPAPSGKTDSEPKEEPRVSVTRPCGNELLQNGESSNQPIDIDDLLDGMDVEDILEAGKSPYLTASKKKLTTSKTWMLRKRRSTGPQ